MITSYTTCPFCENYFGYDKNDAQPDGTIILKCHKCEKLFSIKEFIIPDPPVNFVQDFNPHTALVDSPDVVQEYLANHQEEADEVSESDSESSDEETAEASEEQETKKTKKKGN